MKRTWLLIGYGLVAMNLLNFGFALYRGAGTAMLTASGISLLCVAFATGVSSWLVHHHHDVARKPHGR